MGQIVIILGFEGRKSQLWAFVVSSAQTTGKGAGMAVFQQAVISSPFWRFLEAIRFYCGRHHISRRPTQEDPVANPND